MTYSIFTVFKPSLGPSSSHTTGPMAAAESFVKKQQRGRKLLHIKSLEVILHGSLAATGIGHCTDKAILYGLSGYTAKTIDSTIIEEIEAQYKNNKTVKLAEKQEIPFSLRKNLHFKPSVFLPFHPNSLQFVAYGDDKKELVSEVYYSIGGGIIVSEHDLENNYEDAADKVPYPFVHFNDLYKIGEEKNLSLAEMALANEDYYRSSEKTFAKINEIIQVMESCIHEGSRREGHLPGLLKVRRRAFDLLEKLKTKVTDKKDPLNILDWVNLYALAVNEENASGAKIITAPTNGAAGIIPAVFTYYKKHTSNPSQKGIYDFFLTAGLIGSLYMKKASISGAEVGCQGEVGVACSMAAGGLTAALGGSNRQIEKAAEIGMEHNLGLTCDPINGLVQIPCIERNAMASIKAINASRIALMSHRRSFVSLDQVIETMYQTGLDMQNKYKETSTGGLAVNVTNC